MPTSNGIWEKFSERFGEDQAEKVLVAYSKHARGRKSLERDELLYALVHCSMFKCFDELEFSHLHGLDSERTPEMKVFAQEVIDEENARRKADYEELVMIRGCVSWSSTPINGSQTSIMHTDIAFADGVEKGGGSLRGTIHIVEK